MTNSVKSAKQNMFNIKFVEKSENTVNGPICGKKNKFEISNYKKHQKLHSKQAAASRQILDVCASARASKTQVIVAFNILQRKISCDVISASFGQGAGKLE